MKREIIWTNGHVMKVYCDKDMQAVVDAYYMGVKDGEKASKKSKKPSKTAHKMVK
jgi:hypothetical protein